jgi:uncharacterized repeat protein (TIGR01451 family)
MPSIPSVPEAKPSEVTTAGHSRILAASLGVSLLLIVALFAALMLIPVDAHAATAYALTNSTGTANWTDITKWSPTPPAGGPGQAPGDSVTINPAGGSGLNIDAAPAFPVIVTQGAAGPLITVPSGQNFSIAAGSSIASTLKVLSGGTLKSGGLTVANAGNLWLFDGTLIDNATLTVASGGTLTFDGGTIVGSAGTSHIDLQSGTPGAALNLSGSQNNMVVQGETINASGSTITLSSIAVHSLTLDLNSSIALTAGSFFYLQSDSSISGAGSISLVSGTIFSKTSGSATDVSVTFNDSGASVGAPTGSLIFSGNSAHAGSYSTGSTGGITLTGGSGVTHTLNSGFSCSGVQPLKLDGNGTIFTVASSASVFSGVQWDGGTINGPGTLYVSSTSLISAITSSVTLDGNLATNNTTINYSPTGANLLSIGGSGTLTLNSPGTLNIAGDFDINGTGIINVNSGAFLNKTSGGAGSHIYPFVSAYGNLSNAALGALALSGGGNWGGNFFTNTSSTFAFDAGTFQWTGGSISGGGGLLVNGGTLDISFPFALPLNNSLKLSGGTLTGSGTITIPSLVTMTWSGGTWSGAGTTTVANGGTLKLDGTSASMLLDARAITNFGTFDYYPGSTTPSLTLANGATITNNNIFQFRNDGRINSDATATAINNTSGSVLKIGGTGTAIIKPTFNHTGSGVSTGAGFGSIEIDGGGISTSPWNVASGTSIIFAPSAVSTYNWNAGTSFNATGGTVQVQGPGSVDTTSISFSSGTLDVEGGTLKVNGNSSVSSPAAMKWYGGAIAGSSNLTINSGVTVDATTGSAARTLSAATFTNNGTFNLAGAQTNPITINSSANFNVTASGIVDLQGDGQMLTDGSGTFNNAGIVKKTVGSSGFRFDTPYKQTAGDTDSRVAGGTIIFAGGGSLTGGIIESTTAGALTDFFGGTFTISGGSLNPTGSGVVRLEGSTATLNVNAPVSTRFFTLDSGTLQGTAAMTIPSGGTFIWNGGTILNDTAAVSVAVGAALNFAGASPTPMLLDNSLVSLLSVGSTYHPIAGGQGNQLTMQNGSQVVVANGGKLTLSDDSDILNGGGTASSLTIDGYLQKSAGITSHLYVPVVATATSTLESAAGALKFNAGGSSGGTINSLAGATVEFPASTFTIAGLVGAGSGSYALSGATLNVTAATCTIPNLTFSAGTLNPGSNTTVSGMTWSGGTISGAASNLKLSGTTIIPPAAAITTISATNVTNMGSFLYQTTANALTIGNGSTFTNSSTFDMQSDTSILCNCAAPPQFVNTSPATLKKSGSTSLSQTTFAVPFNNDGTVTATVGRILFTAAGTHTGTFDAPSAPASQNSTLAFSGSNTFNASTVFSGNGTFAFSGGTSTIAGSFAVPGIVDLSGAANVLFNGTTSIGTLALNGSATLGGSGSVQITGASGNSTWGGGTITGGGAFALNNGAVMNATGATSLMSLNNRTFTNNGTFNYTAGANNLSIDNSASFVNAAGATFDSQGSSNIAKTGVATITNAGTFEKTVAGLTTINPAVTNTGAIQAIAGQLAFLGGLTQSAGSITLAGGSVYAPTQIVLTGGTVAGTGSITGLSNTGATITPGTAGTVGALTISGPYTQGSSGKIALDLGGTTPATYDTIDFGNIAPTFDGTLSAAFIGGFTPSNGDTFSVLNNFTSHSGDFATYTLPTFPAGGHIQSSYGASGLTLLAATIQTDLSLGQGIPASPVHNTNATWTYTVSNGGPDAATGATFTSTFSNATFVAASSSVGTCSAAGSTITCSIGSLSSGSSANIAVTLNASAAGSINTTAAVSNSVEFDPQSANDGVSSSVTVLPAADLAVTVTTSPGSVNAGAALSYGITVSNGGPDAASGTTTLNIALPAGATGVTTSSAGAWSCAPPTATNVTCSSTSVIAASSSLPVLTVSMNAPPSGPATLTATVSSTTADPSSANNSGSASATIITQADLQITTSGGAATFAGQTATFTTTLTNAGPSSANAVTVSSALPAGVTFASNSGMCVSNFPCSFGTLLSGQSVTFTTTYNVSSSYSGSSVAQTVTASSTTADPNSANNSATAAVSVSARADIGVTMTGASTLTAGSTATYVISITNNGPSDAAGVQLSNTASPRLAFTGNSGACTTPFPCNIGSLAAGQTKVITSSYNVLSGTISPIVNSVAVTSSTTDPNPANNSASVSASAACFTTPGNLLPAEGVHNVPTSGQFTWAGDASSYNIYLGPSGSGCNGAAPFATSGTNALLYNALNPNTDYEWRVEAVGAGCPTLSSSCVHFTTAGNCPTQPPSLIAPANGATVSSPITLQWAPVPNATSYHVIASINGAAALEIGSGSSPSLVVNLPNGSVIWTVQAVGDGCNNVNSASGSFTVCNIPDSPIVSVAGTSTSGQGYTISWTAVQGATNYEIDEATNAGFNGAITRTVTTTSLNVVKDVTTAAAFFYRVRAIGDCTHEAGPYSRTARIVIAPPPSPSQHDTNINVPFGSQQSVSEQIFVPGIAGGSYPFTASVDQPWLQVTPTSGLLTPAGVTLTVTANPSSLENGTNTGTVILTLGSGKTGSVNASTSVSVPVSISLVTPITPGARSTPPANALIIPSIGHLDGASSQWRSDIRVSNVSSSRQKYLLTFTPANSDDLSKDLKQTSIDVDAGGTTALDDIVRNWYGLGAFGDGTNGVLEIRPLSGSGKGATPDAVSIQTATVASSRTYNSTANGTLGQFIPALSFGGFIGAATQNAQAQALTLQQIAQSDKYRTNLGVVEAAGAPASVLVSVYDTLGKKLLDVPLDLKGGEQRQINSFLAANGIASLPDGRIEVRVTSGSGRITAYASVVDNATNDPLLVSGVPLNQTASSSYVVPGAADLNTGVASWRTDMRIFNAGTAPQDTTLTYYAQSGNSVTRSIPVNPGEVKALDSVVGDLFGSANTGGAVHVSTGSASNLVITARTYNQTDNGTYGQFIPAVSQADAVGKNDRTLHILQVEDSVRYRTNLGLAETSGKPALIEVSIFTAGSKVVPKVQIPMQANEFKQLPIISQLGLGATYNARISVRVLDGEGKVTAYGSVIDMTTQDPTFVPAQ